MRKRLLTLMAVVLATAAIIPIANASDIFTDVDDTNIFHDDIAWLAAAGVTKGCNPPDNTEFCPSNAVTREQMAAFMKRLAESQAVDAGTLMGSLPGVSNEQISFITNGEDQQTLATIDIDAPGAGTVMIEVHGSLWINLDSADDDADITSLTMGICESEADTPGGCPGHVYVWYEDPDDTSGFNAQVPVIMRALVEVPAAGPLTYYLVADPDDATETHAEPIYVTVTYMPANSLAGSVTLSSPNTGDAPNAGSNGQ